MAPRDPRVLENWSGEHRWRPVTVHHPASEEDVARCVSQVAARPGGRIKPFGARHSWSDVAVSGGEALCLDGMQRVLAIDRAACTVRVEAGVRLRALVAALDAAGLALPNLGSIAEQSLAGAIATGTHGTGLSHGPIGAGVIGARLVTGAGELVALEDGDPRLDGVRCHLGALGVLTELTLRVVPAFDLALHAEPLQVATVLRDFERIRDSAERVKLWWIPHTDRVMVYRMAETRAPRRGRGRLADALERRSGPLMSALLGIGAALPPAIPTLNRAIRALSFREHRRVGPSAAILNVVGDVPRHHEMSYAVPLPCAKEAFSATVEAVARSRWRVDFIFELRFVAGDTAWLSPTEGEARCHLGAYAGGTPDRRPFFAWFEAAMLARGGRPHWGKQHRLDAAQAAERFPHLRRFVALRDAWDPRGIFANAFTDRLLGPPPGPR